MRLAEAEHTSRPWRIHELVEDFDVADVWALPTSGGQDDLARLARVIACSDESLMSNPLVRALFSIRMKVGGRFGMDEFRGGLDWSLRERLPSDLRDGPRGPDVRGISPFRRLIVGPAQVRAIARDWAAETTASAPVDARDA